MSKYALTADEYEYCRKKSYLLHPEYVWSNELNRYITANGQEIIDREDERRAMMKADYAWQAAFDGIMAMNGGIDAEIADAVWDACAADLGNNFDLYDLFPKPVFAGHHRYWAAKGDKS